MNSRRLSCLFVLAATLSLIPVPGICAPSTPSLSVAMQFLSAADPRFHYEGRFDLASPAGPVAIWQGSRIGLDFSGAQLVLHFDGIQGQNFFDVAVDDAIAVLSVPPGPGRRLVFPEHLGEGRHHLTVFKRSEAAAGWARFTGVEIAAGAKAWTPAEPAYRLRMEFFGDSITAGACNEDGATDQWENFRTHNNVRSYAALTAAALAADYRNIAVSGMGIAAGYVEVRAGQVWDRAYPVAGSRRADLNAWQPDVAFVNFGENDDSFTRNNGQPFPAGFTDGYVALVRGIRQAYPKAQLVLLRGGMFGGAQSAPLREAWETAVHQLEAGDPAIHSFVFTHWSANHPRVADDRAMADELIAWLRARDFIKTL